MFSRRVERWRTTPEKPIVAEIRDNRIAATRTIGASARRAGPIVNRKEANEKALNAPGPDRAEDLPAEGDGAKRDILADRFI